MAKPTPRTASSTLLPRSAHRVTISRFQNLFYQDIMSRGAASIFRTTWLRLAYPLRCKGYCLSNGLVGLAKIIQFCQRNTELAISLTDMPRFKNSHFCPHTNWRQSPAVSLKWLSRPVRPLAEWITRLTLPLSPISRVTDKSHTHGFLDMSKKADFWTLLHPKMDGSRQGRR